jgi:hypothetical protein
MRFEIHLRHTKKLVPRGEESCSCRSRRCPGKQGDQPRYSGRSQEGGACCGAKVPTCDVFELALYSILSEVTMSQQISTSLLQEYLGFQGGSSLQAGSGRSNRGLCTWCGIRSVRSGRNDVPLVLGLEQTSDFRNSKTQLHEFGSCKGIANETGATWPQPVLLCDEAFIATCVLNPCSAKNGTPRRAVTLRIAKSIPSGCRSAVNARLCPASIVFLRFGCGSGQLNRHPSAVDIRDIFHSSSSIGPIPTYFKTSSHEDSRKVIFRNERRGTISDFYTPIF